jgi:ABC-type lipoprotein release transport system permease subunit
LIAGVNVATLLLMQTAERQSELAMRVALGASSARLIRKRSTKAVFS